MALLTKSGPSAPNNTQLTSALRPSRKLRALTVLITMLLGLPLSANAGFLDSIRDVQNTISSIGQTANTIRGSKKAVEDLSQEVGIKDQNKDLVRADRGTNAVITGAVLQGKLNHTKLYSQPDKSSTPVAVLSKQDVMIFMGSEQNDFYFIQSDRGEGWVLKPLVSVQ